MKRLFAGFALVTLALAAFVALNTPQASVDADVTWSKTKPKINMTHILEGEVNFKDTGGFKGVTGYHALVNGDVRDDRKVKVTEKPNRLGIYTGTVQFQDPRDSSWNTGKKWTKKSSFFPKKWREKQIIKAVLYAYKHGYRSGAKFTGPSTKKGHRAFTISGYLNSDGTINTAFPLYEADDAILDEEYNGE